MSKDWNEFFPSVKTSTYCAKALISMKLMKFTVLYTGTMKGGEWLLRKRSHN